MLHQNLYIKNIFSESRFVFQNLDKPKVSNENNRMKNIMTMETKDEEITKDRLDDLSKGYGEINKFNKEHNNLIKTAKKNLRDANGGKLPHGMSSTVYGKDNREYIYIRDNFAKNPDRLFAGAELSSAEDEYAKANLEEGYQRAGGKQAKKIARAAKKLLEGNPPSTIVELDDLVANNLITQDEADDIDGDIAYIIKIKGKTKVFFGYESA